MDPIIFNLASRLIAAIAGGYAVAAAFSVWLFLHPADAARRRRAERPAGELRYIRRGDPVGLRRAFQA
ncbi:MAG: hypothetical protein RIE56_06025 [Amphiplicatus sp.]